MTDIDNNLEQDITGEESLEQELDFLFGAEIVEQARLIDIADLHLTDAMTAGIGEGIRQLKLLRNDPAAQRQWLGRQEAGLRLLLCMWIRDMDLLEKIQVRSYVKKE